LTLGRSSYSGCQVANVAAVDQPFSQTYSLNEGFKFPIMPKSVIQIRISLATPARSMVSGVGHRTISSGQPSFTVSKNC
jgi:hypothetical protein